MPFDNMLYKIVLETERSREREKGRERGRERWICAEFLFLSTKTINFFEFYVITKFFHIGKHKY